MLAMNKVLAVELAKFNIRVNCIAPGLIKTKLSTAVNQLLRTTLSVQMKIPEKLVLTLF